LVGRSLPRRPDIWAARQRSPTIIWWRSAGTDNDVMLPTRSKFISTGW